MDDYEILVCMWPMKRRELRGKAKNPIQIDTQL